MRRNSLETGFGALPRSVALSLFGCVLMAACGGRSTSYEQDSGSAGGGRDAGGRAGRGGAESTAGRAGSLQGGSNAGGAAGAPEPCGNTKLDPGEECDDGNRVNGDGCTASCLIEFDRCTASDPCPVTPVCADAVLSPGEGCDDGNLDDADGCSDTCAVEPGWTCDAPGRACQPICGDILRVGDEACDDGNTVSGDGCSPSCRVEPGFECDEALPSQCTHEVCGDGELDPGEDCDAGELNGVFYGNGDGCTLHCSPEPFCRDTHPRDTHPCETFCGDGNIDLREACDDGNRFDGDGCSAQCSLEAGFGCSEIERVGGRRGCVPNDDEPCVPVGVHYRDFEPQGSERGHPDFFYLGAPALAHQTGVTEGADRTTCVPDGISGSTGAQGICPSDDAAGECPGIAADRLNAWGYPELARDTCPCAFTDRYDTGILEGVPGVESCTSSELGIDVLRVRGEVKVVDSPESFAGWFREADRAVDSRTGWLTFVELEDRLLFASGAPGSGEGIAFRTLRDDLHENCRGVPTPLASGFFPLEEAAGAKRCNLDPYWLYSGADTDAACRSGAGFPALYQWDERAAFDSCPLEGQGGPVPSSSGAGEPVQGTLRNLYFTSELRYPFVYRGDFTLAFQSTDDLWVFVDGKLALDLGGTHSLRRGSVVVDASFALEPGNTYELAIFHANRRPGESDLVLELPRSVKHESWCLPTCGDGMVVGGEACDDGVNDGHYGGCAPDCTRAPYCGDGVPDPEFGEECDGGADNGSSSCGTNCRIAQTQ